MENMSRGKGRDTHQNEAKAVKPVDAKSTNPSASSPENIDIFSFIYLGYNKQNYSWEVIMFLKKLMLTFISVFTEFFPSHSKAIILLVTLIFFLYLNVRRKPYVTDFLTNFDTLSLVVSFITASIGVLLFSKDLHPANPFFMIIIIIINVGFLVLWVYFFFVKSFGRGIWGTIIRTLRTNPLNIFKVFNKSSKYDTRVKNVEAPK